MSGEEDEFKAIADPIDRQWYGIGLSGHVTSLPGDDDCRRLVDLDPERAAKFAQTMHDRYVSARCDAFHVRGSREEFEHSRESEDYAEYVRDLMVRAGAASPRQTTCLHGMVP